MVENNYCFAKSNRLLEKKDLIFLLLSFQIKISKLSNQQNWQKLTTAKNWFRKSFLDFFATDHFNADQLKMRNVPGFVSFKKQAVCSLRFLWFYDQGQNAVHGSSPDLMLRVSKQRIMFPSNRLGCNPLSTNTDTSML